MSNTDGIFDYLTDDALVVLTDGHKPGDADYPDDLPLIISTHEDFFWPRVFVPSLMVLRQWKDLLEKKYPIILSVQRAPGFQCRVGIEPRLNRGGIFEVRPDWTHLFTLDFGALALRAQQAALGDPTTIMVRFPSTEQTAGIWDTTGLLRLIAAYKASGEMTAVLRQYTADYRDRVSYRIDHETALDINDKPALWDFLASPTRMEWEIQTEIEGKIPAVRVAVASGLPFLQERSWRLNIAGLQFPFTPYKGELQISVHPGSSLTYRLKKVGKQTPLK